MQPLVDWLSQLPTLFQDLTAFRRHGVERLSSLSFPYRANAVSMAVRVFSGSSDRGPGFIVSQVDEPPED